MNNQSRENLVNDIENRLDDFFGEGPLDEAPPAVSLEKLKSVVLSIDWEMTESSLNELVTEAGALIPHFENDRLVHTLLRMLKAVGAYMRKRQVRSHPDAIKRIMSVFASIEKMVSEKQMGEDLKKALVAREIAAFKKLKEQIDIQRAPVQQVKKEEETTSQEDQCNAAYVEHSKFEKAMSAVEERLNSQVTQLKAQLEALQNELDALRTK